MHEVLIRAAGPTGLVLALWLARQGLKVSIVDKSAGPRLQTGFRGERTGTR